MGLVRSLGNWSPNCANKSGVLITWILPLSNTLSHNVWWTTEPCQTLTVHTHTHTQMMMTVTIWVKRNTGVPMARQPDKAASHMRISMTIPQTLMWKSLTVPLNNVHLTLQMSLTWNQTKNSIPTVAEHNNYSVYNTLWGQSVRLVDFQVWKASLCHDNRCALWFYQHSTSKCMMSVNYSVIQS